MDATTHCYFLQWDERNKKKVVDLSIADAKTEFSKQLTILRKHNLNAKTQLHQKKLLKEKLVTNEIILQEDFFENFPIKQQGDIMLAHLGPARSNSLHGSGDKSRESSPTPSSAMS